MSGHQPERAFALVVFDGGAPIEPQTVQTLERMLQSSERFALALTVKVRAAPLAESDGGAVVGIALAGVPSHVPDSRVVECLEGCLTQLGQRGSRIAEPRNLAIAALGQDPRVINEGASALRHLLQQVGSEHEPFGKILRIFTPPGIDCGKDPIARRAAANKLRAKLAARIQDMLADAQKSGALEKFRLGS
jgi:DNA-binding IscR family transcriptional regulator